MQDSDEVLSHSKASAFNSRRFFFKYMSFETALAVMQNRTLRWSTPSLLNDPFDLSFQLRVDVDFERVKQLALDQNWNDHFGDNPARPGNRLGEVIALSRQLFARKGKTMSRDEFGAYFGSAIDESLAKVLPGVETAGVQVQPMLDRTKVLCLCGQPNDMLMWSHYAQQHNGVVIRFENLPELDSPYCMAQEVTYASAMPHWVDEQGLADLLSGRAQSDPVTLSRKLVFTKSQDWSYEREWRICGGFGRDTEAPFEDLTFAEQELESVIFGCRMPADRRILLMQAAGLVNHKVKFWSAIPSSREFRMDITLTT